MKKLKKVAVLLFTLLIMANIVMVNNSFAKEQESLSPTEGVSAKKKNYGESSIHTNDLQVQSFQYLSTGKTYIKKVSSTIVTVGGSTEAYSAVDTIAVNLYLQRWDASSGVWLDVVDVGENKNYNSSIVSDSVNINVVSGYYYRTRGYHWVNMGGTIEQANSYTSYIYVD